MLFVSRYIGKTQYGVVDTDDWKEEVVSYEQIQDACVNHRLEIMGTEVSTSNFENYFYLFVVDIFPYQPPELISHLQTKTRVLKHVDVTAYNFMITSVFIDAESITSPKYIRLSDYGVFCADCFLENNRGSREHKVTLVLDDRIEVSELAFHFRRQNEFQGIGRIGVKVDISEVTNKETLRRVFSSFNGSIIEANRYIVDRHDRIESLWNSTR